MKRRLFYLFSLIGFFLVWAVFDFAAAAPRSEHGLDATVVTANNTDLTTDSTNNSGIPITGRAQPVREILLAYGFFGIGALTLILALLSAANKATAPAVRRKEPEEQS